MYAHAPPALTVGVKKMYIIISVPHNFPQCPEFSQCFCSCLTDGLCATENPHGPNQRENLAQWKELMQLFRMFTLEIQTFQAGFLYWLKQDTSQLSFLEVITWTNHQDRNSERWIKYWGKISLSLTWKKINYNDAGQSRGGMGWH